MKILLVQTSFLGDTILSTPVIKGLRKLHPDAEIWMMTTPLSSFLVKKDPLLKGVIPFDKRGRYSGFKGLFEFAGILRKYEFDMVYSLHKSIRTSFLLFLSGIPERICFDTAKGSFLYHKIMKRKKDKHDVIRNLSILPEKTLNNISTDMRLFPPSYEETGDLLKSLVKEDEEYAVLVPGSAWATKMWHGKGYKKTADYLSEKGLKVILMGSSDDKACCSNIAGNAKEIINLAGKTSIAEALYIMSRAKLAVCNDSMSLHMASAFKIPTAVIFCSTIPEFGYGPWANEKAVVVEKKLPCRPCGSHGKVKCPKKTNECMEGISEGEVIRAIESLGVV